ncbi:class I SAM-dependent DNA methyltransferase [Clostridium sp. FP1]|uniref:HsdM family class I SAM-dependent methyltransferase n=1 Tax=Clostridium sp. FP1 TaxID=2724076 RepID=UPI0013E90D11|nr:N-6 DNA methylase [Clostridium sp. FP1]MBZ9633319.1 BREX-1 system adenine-specific DNA-methyltransferase PglX [Clostridium sp. FP1]
MEYISASEIASEWNLSKRRVQILCSEGRVRDAKRIGNMWVVPLNSKKPNDARYKEQAAEIITTKTGANPIRLARTDIKRLLNDIVKNLKKGNFDNEEMRKYIVVSLASTLLQYYLSSGNEKIEVDFDSVEVQSLINKYYFNSKYFTKVSKQWAIAYISKEFYPIIKKHKYCLDDMISWTYQYLNKPLGNEKFANTQFFTEKYMLTYLIDKLEITKDNEKILDPACGGGNFLLYALDVICDSKISSKTKQKDILKITQEALNRLLGYDLDAEIAIISSINLRLKVLSILLSHGISIDIEIWNTLNTNIYFSANENILGFLDVAVDIHTIQNTYTKELLLLSDVLRESKYIVTNPPFQTVKGMNRDLKEYLKAKYPLSKCDVCNAFLEQILTHLNVAGKCGVVTQNSWMFLDSFTDLRKQIIENYAIDSIVELGSNSFYDLNGEKASVALVTLENNLKGVNELEFIGIKNETLAFKESVLSFSEETKNYKSRFVQRDFLKNKNYRLDFLSTGKIKEAFSKLPIYGDFATPMQGTSTGNAAELIDYFWNHFSDEEWTLVSKGGGYSRWNGLNRYKLKWGKNGEYIKETKGSAMRNVKYFDCTELVFSDTGTSGLNVRLLQKNQLFVASGPGIRISDGNKYTHIALLNSRLYSYYLKIICPKLTIAAGYISKIPTVNKLINSSSLASSAKRCCEFKNNFLYKRPTNFEYKELNSHNGMKSIKQLAMNDFLDDVSTELERLKLEYEIDCEIMNAYSFSKMELNKIKEEVGICAFAVSNNIDIASIDNLDIQIDGLLNINCELKRTRSSKTSLGCDGILEFLADEYTYNPTMVCAFLQKNIDNLNRIIKKYKCFIMHRIVLTLVKYSPENGVEYKSVSKADIVQHCGICKNDANELLTWIETGFNEYHKTAFRDNPFLKYEVDTKVLKFIK